MQINNKYCQNSIFCYLMILKNDFYKILFLIIAKQRSFQLVFLYMFFCR